MSISSAIVYTMSVNRDARDVPSMRYIGRERYSCQQEVLQSQSKQDHRYRAEGRRDPPPYPRAGDGGVHAWAPAPSRRPVRPSAERM